jgi:hypothetical protein
MMFSIPDKPKVCPVCGSEPQATQESTEDNSMRFRCGARWVEDRLITRHAEGIIAGYTGWIPTIQCGWATPIALELLAGKLYDPSVPRFKQVVL